MPKADRRRRCRDGGPRSCAPGLRGGRDPSDGPLYGLIAEIAPALPDNERAILALFIPESMEGPTVFAGLKTYGGRKCRCSITRRPFVHLGRSLWPVRSGALTRNPSNDVSLGSTCPRRPHRRLQRTRRRRHSRAHHPLQLSMVSRDGRRGPWDRRDAALSGTIFAALASDRVARSAPMSSSTPLATPPPAPQVGDDPLFLESVRFIPSNPLSSDSNPVTFSVRAPFFLAAQ